MFDGVFPKAGFIYIAGDRIAALFIFLVSCDRRESFEFFFAVYFTF